MNAIVEPRPTLTKQRLAREVGRRTRLSNKVADTALEAVIAIISEQLSAGGRVEIANFLTLDVRAYKRIAAESEFCKSTAIDETVYFVLHCKPGKRLQTHLRALTTTKSPGSGE